MPSRLIWFGTSPWKGPSSTGTTDLLERVLDYRVPVDKVSDLVRFDGSLVFDRTQGELSVTCDLVPMNLLAVNLAHEVTTGRRSVDDARTAYAEMANEFVMGRPAPYTEELTFTPAHGGTADVDETQIAAAMIDQTAEKMKDVVGRAS